MQISFDVRNTKSLLLQTFSKATRIGIEPTTSAVTGRRSNQLSHRARDKVEYKIEWTFRDSNPGPTGYEPVALTN